MFPKNVLPGYLWIFPLPDGRANVGLCIRADLLARRSPEKLKHIFQNTLLSPYIAAEMEGATCISPLVGHYLPLATFARHLVFDRALAAWRRSAGFINPFTGEGIDLAIDSAIQAAETIQNSEARGDFSKRVIGVQCEIADLLAVYEVATSRMRGRFEGVDSEQAGTVVGEPRRPCGPLGTDTLRFQRKCLWISCGGGSTAE